jgi:alkanesulfonate monooxygenase SsuD/methylene tetrahydromethanopterin reductase-like flavin-dependent oxidoreductase (luciferase family)
MRIGIVILPERRWHDGLAQWRRVDELGFDNAWTYDHLSWRSLADGPWFGAVPLLSAAAAVTSRIGLGTLVATPNFRHPVPFAKELMTVDDISNGRLILGAGAGGMGYDYTVLGGEPLSLDQRSSRFSEFVTLLDQLLREPETSFVGEYFSATEARMVPGCVQLPRIPMWIAANGPRMMKLAARFGEGWITTGKIDAQLTPEQWWSSVADLSTAFDQTLVDEGKDSADFRRLLALDSAGETALKSTEYFRDCVGRAAELGFTDVAAVYPRKEGLFAGDASILDAIAP